jgi:hypothetical protein
MAVTITIAGVDKSNRIAWDSLRKVEVLSHSPDTLSFMIRTYGATTYKPNLGDEVVLLSGATRIFGGFIVSMSDTIEGLAGYTQVQCKDYTLVLDRQLVSTTYTNQTVAAIVTAIIGSYTTGFTTANVVGTDIVPSVTFNYMTVSQAIQKLCDLLGNYDWYVDYNKDIHLFALATNLAAFNLTDTSQNFNWNSLSFNGDTKQIRNDIIVRGGQVTGTAVDNLQIVDGKQRVFFVGYNLSTFLAYKALAATPTSFSSLTVGADGKDDPASFNALYNPDRGLLTFPDASKPAINDVLKYTGVPTFPLISEVKDPVSIVANGTYQYVIVDKTITTREGAAQRARAELVQYSNPLYTAKFTTYTDGLRSGQYINITSATRNVNANYKIQQITTTLKEPTGGTLLYAVECVSARSLELVDLLNKLLVKNVSDQITIGQNEVVDTVYAVDEEITVTATPVVSTSHNPQNQTITLGESVTVQALNYAVIFVVGALAAPSGTSRLFILNGSLVG